MPKPPDSPLEFGPWPAGMNNRQPDYALPQGTLRNVVNADIDPLGYCSRRVGYDRVYGGVTTHSGFSCPTGTFFCEGGALKKLNDDNTATVLRSSLNGDRVAYEHFDGVVYFSDGAATGKIVNGLATPWGMDIPPAPQLMTVAGSHGPGTYIAALTAVDADGRESGASDTVTIQAPDATGIRFFNLPSTTTLRLYLSAPNGTVLYLAAEVPAGTATQDILTGRYDGGKTMDTQFVSKPPPGTILRVYNGVMYIVDGKTLWYTEPYALDWVHARKNFIQFTADISILEPVRSGIFVVADRTYFLRGSGPSDFVQEEKLPYGAVFGTSSRISEAEGVMWYSTKGVVLGDAGGEVVNKQEANVAADSGTSGASMVRDYDGIQQFVASIENPVVSPLAARSFFEAEVVRKSTP